MQSPDFKLNQDASLPALFPATKRPKSGEMNTREVSAPPSIPPRPTPSPKGVENTNWPEEGVPEANKSPQIPKGEDIDAIAGRNIGFVMGQKRVSTPKASQSKTQVESTSVDPKMAKQKFDMNKMEINHLSRELEGKLEEKAGIEKEQKDLLAQIYHLVMEVTDPKVSNLNDKSKTDGINRLKSDLDIFLSELQHTTKVQDTEIQRLEKEIKGLESKKKALVDENKELYEQMNTEPSPNPGQAETPARTDTPIGTEEKTGGGTQKQRVTQEVKNEVIQYLSNKAKLIKSEDMGGHGGNSHQTVQVGGIIHHLFLKPFDPEDVAEFRNYHAIELLSPELMGHMPTVYGKATIEGKEYLVMENTRAEGAKQLADVKLSGKVADKADFNPICNQGEMVAVHGKPKGFLDYSQMKAGADKAGDYIFYKGANWTRFFHMSNSSKNFQKSIEEVSDENKKQLVKEIEIIRHNLSKSGVATIGVSMMLVKDKDGKVKPILIDPAHIILDPNRKKDLETKMDEEDLNKLYFGETMGEFEVQQKSNDNSLDKILKDIVATIKT